MLRPAAPLAWDRRVALWDAVMAAVRGVLRAAGLREVSTPTRVDAPAIEPYIEPIAAAGKFLATSPELAMKRLLCRGSGPIFQLAHVFRGGEVGDRHSEVFHLLEWYRLGDDLRAVEADVEAIVAAVFAVAGLDAPARWRRASFFEVFAETTGVALRGDEDAQALAATLAAVPGLHAALSPGPGVRDLEVRTLAAWVALFSAWSDGWLDRWLAQQPGGVHLGEFPAALAALAQRDVVGGRALAHRVESYVGDVELANGYRELRDADEQRRRFATVNGLRVAHARPALPLDEGFLGDLVDPGLPACTGMALGLDRLIMLACGVPRLDHVTLALGPR
jgi:elongation factor P--(R)-beta-lysine ligase